MWRLFSLGRFTAKQQPLAAIGCPALLPNGQAVSQQARNRHSRMRGSKPIHSRLVGTTEGLTKTIEIPEAVTSRRCFLKISNGHEELRGTEVTKAFKFVCLFGI